MATNPAVKDYTVLFESGTMLPVERRTTHEFVDFMNQAMSATHSLATHDLSCDGTALDPDAHYIAIGHSAAVKVGLEVSELADLGPEGILVSAKLASPHVVVTGGIEKKMTVGDVATATSTVVAPRGTMYALHKVCALAAVRRLIVATD